MSSNNATFEVDGPAAHQIAKNILTNLGMDIEAIEEVDMGLEFNGKGTTSIDIDADGPLAGVLVAQMVKGVEWDDHTATAIDATFREVQTEDDSASGDTDDTSGSQSNGPYKPQVTPLVDKVDPEYVEFPGNEPGRMRENTQAHIGACLLVEWYETMDGKWVNNRELSDFAGDDLTYKQLQSVMSRLFVNKGLTVRRQARGADKRMYEYHPTKQLVEEVERLGEYDSEAVRKNTENHSK